MPWIISDDAMETLREFFVFEDYNAGDAIQGAIRVEEEEPIDGELGITRVWSEVSEDDPHEMCDSEPDDVDLSDELSNRNQMDHQR
jgi:hypothetical protein